MKIKYIYYAVFKNNDICFDSISYQRKLAISRFLKKSNLTWEEAKKYGWRVGKFEITVKKL